VLSREGGTAEPKGEFIMSTHIHPFPEYLNTIRKEIEAHARTAGLDFYEVIFEILDYEQLNQVAAYTGFPTRYPHWRFGMEYEDLRKKHVYGLARIYEMVINNDPCYAYLLKDNSLMDQKLVMAHVYAHCDFFKNNIWFGQTSRKMMDEMANHATRIRKHIEHHGHDPVESFLDVCLSLENQIDPHTMYMRRRAAVAEKPKYVEDDVVRIRGKSYMDRFLNPAEGLQKQREKIVKQREENRKKEPASPVRDVLLYVLEHAPLEDWQRDVLSIVREEAYYFAPQAMTKIMNEGWATFWHSRLMTTKIATAAEIVDYADHHSGTVASGPGRFNPYKIGVELFRDIEERWNTGRHGKEYDECDDTDRKRKWDTKAGEGIAKVFEVRRIYNDVTFIDEFLTPEFVDKHKLYRYRYDPATGMYQIVSRDYKEIKRQLLFSLTNRGEPFIYVVDGNYCNRGELYLAHQHNGVDIQVSYAVPTLKNVFRLWGRPVHLQARIDDEQRLFSYNGEELTEQRIHDDTPAPANKL
jgi:stage V sporulation protein R